MNNSRKKIRKIKKIQYPLLFLLVTLFLFGCDYENKNVKETLEEGDVLIYYVDKNETKIASQIYTPENTSPEELAIELLDKMKEEPENFSNKTSWPENIVVDKFSLNKNNPFFVVNFNSEYNNLDNITEALFRTCVVKTLCQIEGIDYVEFYVGGQILKINDKPVGLMESKDFIVSTGLEDVVIRVYFSNLEGTALRESNLRVSYDGNISIERLIIERLIAGPIEEDMKNTLPDETVLLKVTTTDGICYVDFNDKFLENVSGVKEEVIIYSVVNSLIELSGISKVQFSINGVPRKTYRESIPFDTFFERNLEIVEGSK